MLDGGVEDNRVPEYAHYRGTKTVGREGDAFDGAPSDVVVGGIVVGGIVYSLGHSYIV